LKIAGQDVEFEYMTFYPGLATLAGQPATVFPIGQTSGGLPMGLQVIGPFLEDRTPMEFAKLIEREIHGFHAPPGYDDELN
jgi:amidase